MRLSPGDFRFLIDTVSPDVTDRARLKLIIEEDQDFRNTFISDKKVFGRVMDDDEIFLKISPSLFFEILLRKAVNDLKRSGYTIEKTSNIKIPVFDANDVVELVEERAKENDIRIYKAFDLTIDEVILDPRTVHRSLLNLVTNAIDACSFDEDMGKNWEICVKTARENGNIIRVEVEDNGVGMEQETKDKLFTSFFSTKGGRGTGIGLLVTKKLIEEHGGTMEFTSEPGDGTMFILRLPFEKAKSI